MVNIHLWKLVCWSPAMDKPETEWRESDWADRLAGKATITGSLCLARSKVMRSLRHYLQAQSQGHLTINCMKEWSEERGYIWYLPWKDEKRPLSIRQTLAILGDFWEMGWSTYLWTFLSTQNICHTEQNWTVYNCIFLRLIQDSFPSE